MQDCVVYIVNGLVTLLDQRAELDTYLRAAAESMTETATASDRAPEARKVSADSITCSQCEVSCTTRDNASTIVPIRYNQYKFHFIWNLEEYGRLYELKN